MKIADLAPAERRLWEAFPRGTRIRFPETADRDPLQAEPDRTVRAEVIRALLLGGAEQDGEVAALRLDRACISGRLDLQYATVDRPISLRACRFERTPYLYGAQVRQLNLSESRLPALDAATLRVEGVLRITGCRIPGEVRLGGARISGAFFLDGARLGEEGGDGAVLQLNHATVGHDVWGVGLVTHGQVRLTGATVNGAVNLNDARSGQVDRSPIRSTRRRVRHHRRGKRRFGHETEQPCADAMGHRRQRPTGCVGVGESDRLHADLAASGA